MVPFWNYFWYFITLTETIFLKPWILGPLVLFIEMRVFLTRLEIPLWSGAMFYSILDLLQCSVYNFEYIR